MNFKDYSVGDWLRVVATVSAAGAAGFATGGYAGLAFNLIGAVAAILQTPPGKISVPK